MSSLATPLGAGRRRRRAFDRPRFLWVVAAFVLLLLLGPLLVVLLYSFNESRSLVRFDGVSLRWYEQVVRDADIRASIWTSVRIAAICTATCAVLGTLMAVGLVRGQRRAAQVNNGVLMARLLAPETATAVALFLLFTQLGFTLSSTTVVIAHVALCLPLVAIIVRARLLSVSQELEPAAMDLGATPFQALRLVVLPLIWPAIAAGSMLTFVVSFDDFITTNFTAGVDVPPLPLRIYSMLRFGVTPVVDAVGILMTLLAVLLTAAAFLLLRLGRRRSAE